MAAPVMPAGLSAGDVLFGFLLAIEGAWTLVPKGHTRSPREFRLRLPEPAGLPLHPSELTVMSRTPRGEAGMNIHL